MLYEFDINERRSVVTVKVYSIATWIVYSIATWIVYSIATWIANVYCIAT